MDNLLASKQASKQARIEWIDIAKGIGILLVLIAHAIDTMTYVWNMITLFHMPLFYIISGYCYKKKERWLEYFKNKIIKLYVPYIIIVFLFYTAELIGSSSSFSVKKIVKMLLLLEQPQLVGAAWFIAVLFVAELVFDVLIRWTEKLKLKIDIVAGIAVVVLPIIMSIQLPLGLSRIGVAIVFLFVGYLYRRNESKIENKKLLCIAVFVVAMLILGWTSVQYYSSYVSNSYDNVIISIISALAGTVIVFGISKLVQGMSGIKRAFIFLGVNTLGIVYFQFVAFILVNAMLTVIHGLDATRILDFPVNYEYNSVAIVGLYVLVGVVVSILIYKVFDTVLKFVAPTTLKH